MKCPICESELVEKYCYTEGPLVEESKYGCNNCSLYSKEFAYGYTQVIIGDFTVDYSYKASESESESLNKKVDALIELYKKEWNNESL